MQPSQSESFFLDEPIEESSTQNSSEPVEESSFFLDEPIETPGKESGLGFTARTAARSGSRVAETLLGLPGDLRNFAGFLGDSIGSGLRSLTGLQPKTEEQLAQDKQLQRKLSYLDPLAYLPTSERLKEASETATGGYTAPQTGVEAFTDDVVSDFASLAIPVKGKIPFARAIGTSLFANLGSQGVKSIGGGDTAAAATKLGLMTVAGLVGRKSAEKHVTSLYDKAESLVPEGAATSTKDMQTNITKLQKNLLKGALTEEKAPTIQYLNSLNAKIQDGKIPVDELIEFRRNANSFLRGNKEKTAKFYMRDFANIINEGLQGYGASNPEFAKIYRDANTGFRGLAESNKISRAISKRVNVNKLDPHTSALLGYTVAKSALSASPGVIAPIAGTASAALGLQTLGRLKNPVLRKHYQSVLKAAAQDNGAGIVRNVNLLDKAMKKEVDETPTEDISSFFVD